MFPLVPCDLPVNREGSDQTFSNVSTGSLHFACKPWRLWLDSTAWTFAIHKVKYPSHTGQLIF